MLPADRVTSNKSEPRGPRPRSKLVQILTATGLALTLGALLAHAFHYAFLTDDAFISFRYARNLSAGAGLVFNPGHEAVEGYTNFLWVLTLAAMDVFGLAPEHSCHVLSIAATIALWGLVVWFAIRGQGEKDAAWLVIVPPLYLAATRSIAVWSTSGLETRFFEVLVVAGVLRLAVEVRCELSGRGARGPLAAFLLALATLTRPDALLIAVVVLVVAGVTLSVAGCFRVRAFAAHIGVYAIIVGGHLAFRVAYYGSWLPNTYYAKVDTSSWWNVGCVYLGSFALEYAAYLWVPLLVVACAFHRARGTLFIPILFVSIIAAHATYIAAIGGDHFEYRPLDLYLPFAFVLLLDAARFLCRNAVASAATGVYLTLILVGLIVLPYQSHKQFPDRYTPGFPGLERNVAFAKDYMLPAADPVYSPPGLRRVATWHRDLLCATTRQLVGIRQEEHRMFLEQVRAEGRRIQEFIDDEKIPGDMHIALQSVGAIPYYTNLRTLDCLGLTDATVARLDLPPERDYMGHEKHTSFEYATRIGVDFWAIDGVHGLWHVTEPDLLRYLQFSKTNDLPLFLAAVSEGYYLVGWLPQGPEATNRKFDKLTFRRGTDRDLIAGVAKEAAGHVRRILEEGPDRHQVRDRLAGLLVIAGDVEGAIQEYRRLTLVRPRHIQTWMKLAAACEQQGDLGGAAEALRRARQLASDAADNALAAKLQARLKYLNGAE